MARETPASLAEALDRLLDPADIDERAAEEDLQGRVVGGSGCGGFS
jgi:hypothetical protein